MGEDISLVVGPSVPAILNKSVQQSGYGRAAAIVRAQASTGNYVPHIGMEEVQRLCRAVESSSRPKFKERNVLMIQTLFDSCIRVSELLTLRPQDIGQADYGWHLRLWSSKVDRWETCSISATLAAKLQSYAYRQQIVPGSKLFPVNRTRVFQIIDGAFKMAGLAKPDGVGTVHIMRHSGALERLQRTKNPQAVQEQLRHKSIRMTLRYMKTLAHEEAIAIQDQVDLQW